MRGVNNIPTSLIEALTPFFLRRSSSETFIPDHDHDGDAGDGGLLDDYPYILSDPVTKTVGPGKDFATIQAAIDWFDGKILSANCTIAIDAGTYTEDLSLTQFQTLNNKYLNLQGDTRDIVGMTYVIGSATRAVPGNQAGRPNGGAGNVTAAVGGGGSTLTVTMSTTNPAFDTAGIVVGDKVRLYDIATGNVTEITLTGVLGNVLTAAAGSFPAGMATLGSAFVFCPNVKVNGYFTTMTGYTYLLGIYFSDTGTYNEVLYRASVYMGKCLFVGHSRCLRVVFKGTATYAYPNSFWESVVHGWEVYDDGYVALSYSGFVKCGSYGVYVESEVDAYGSLFTGCVSAIRAYHGAFAAGNYVCSVGGSHAFYLSYGSNGYFSYARAYSATTIGYLASRGAALSCANATAQGCNYGYYAYEVGFISATGTNANNAGNTTNYSPGTSCTVASCGSLIRWS